MEPGITPERLDSREDWPAVGNAIRGRMTELKMPAASLARKTGLSETTIRYIAQPGRRHDNAKEKPMTTRADRQLAPATAAGEHRHPSISQQKKAERWDYLIDLLRDPQVRNSHVRHLSAMRRAAMMLLANREELPASLTAELKSYKVTLDELHLEAIDGFADVDGIINFLPTYITESLVGELCQHDTPDDDE